MSRLHDATRIDFGSDNYAGAHPEVVEAIAEANGGHTVAYGADPYTARLREVITEHFGAGAEVWPVLNGTGANVVSLQAMAPRWGAVVCSDQAHIATDEGGAPEKVGGLKLLTVPRADARLRPSDLDGVVADIGFEHRAQPVVVSLTQSTELGTCYRPEDVAAIAERAHALGMSVHMDGARLGNAAATLGLPLAELVPGVDVLSLGGTKNGLLFGEAIVVLTPSAVDGLAYLRKGSMQLASKMRFVSAQLVALYGTDLWLRSASHANAMAQRLASAAAAVPGVEITQPVEANAVFARLRPGVATALRRQASFYDWDVADGTVRWMCSFDTTEQAVDDFVAALTAAAANA